MRGWVHKKETGETFEKFGFPKEEIETYFSRRGQVTEARGIRKEYYDMVPKGNAIRDLLGAITNIETTLSNVYVLFFDGDGQIPYDSEHSPIFPLLKELKNGRDVIFGCRGGKYGIGSPRSAIEKFELFLVSNKYGIHLPDGQCGCWGFKARILDGIALRAQGFEIELDLLTSCLRRKIYLDFIHTPVESELGSEFKAVDHQRKLFFLAERFQWDREFTIKKRDEYLKNETLPQSYIEMIETTDWPYIDPRESNQLDRLVSTKKVVPACLGKCGLECLCGSDCRLIDF